jgi:Helix-turn-helix domain
MNNAATTQATTRDQLLTVGDLSNFKQELLGDIKKLLKEQSGHPAKKWLKSHEVRKILGISPGTLQNLRINGTLPSSKLGGVLYYDFDDIQKTLQKHKSPNTKF